VVAVIDSDESDRVALISWKNLATSEEADAWFEVTHARKSVHARAEYAELPRWRRVGALV
jgi:hypothetical protein